MCSQHVTHKHQEMILVARNSSYTRKEGRTAKVRLNDRTRAELRDPAVREDAMTQAEWYFPPGSPLKVRRGEITPRLDWDGSPTGTFDIETTVTKRRWRR
ncbi:hypothetical protein [Actinoallomurus sp. NPDC052274]|uniref:hypothetical protein n=1 Tax=Actinoallomurus sp. NPDC052274 TaxID=3155420 RepID=UPI0034479BAE